MRHYLYTFKDNLVIFNYGFGTYGYVIDGHNININDHEQLLKASQLVRMLRHSMLEDYDGEDSQPHELIV